MLIEDAVKHALSPDRLRTYERAASRNSSHTEPLALYLWNARVSSAFLIPLHICEVVTRNAVAEALAHAHGPRWPWVQGFRDSLPNPTGGHNPRRELCRVAAGHHHAAAEVIPHLSFVFWQKMFTQRFDTRLWSRCLGRVLPEANPQTPFHVVRASMHHDLEQIRRLRNRIAHHEPVFARALADDLHAIGRVVRLRCSHTADWMTGHEAVTTLLRQRPR